jgi:hypothetical protein
MEFSAKHRGLAGRYRGVVVPTHRSFLLSLLLSFWMITWKAKREGGEELNGAMVMT